MNQIQQILQEIKTLLLRMGFEEKTITNQYRSEINYTRENLYCIPQYIEGVGFLIEYAGTLEEAQKHWHEDGNAFPVELGVDAILTELEEEISQNIKA